MKRIIVWNENWADEFDIFGISIIDENLLLDVLNEIKNNPDNFSNYEYYFGTNEGMEFNSIELINKLTKAKYILDSEIKVLCNLNIIPDYSHNELIQESGIAFFSHLYDIYLEIKENED